MSGAYAALLNLSEQYTATTQSAVEIALAERKRKEAAKRKEQEERERKEREQEAKLRLKKLEAEKREQERRQRQEEEERAREREAKRREQAQLDRLLGNKVNKQRSGHGLDYPTSRAAASREKVVDDDGPVALTREELRERKLQASMRRQFGGADRRSGSYASGHSGKSGRRLAGGAIDMVANGSGGTSASAAQSIRARLAAQPNTLTKLNTVKRDTRTIDEIVADLAKAKSGQVVSGEDAKEFNGWFTETKKKELLRKPRSTASPVSGANSPAHPSSSKSNPAPSSVAMSSATKKLSSMKLSSSGANSGASNSLSRPSSSSNLKATPSRSAGIDPRGAQSSLAKSRPTSTMSKPSLKSGRPVAPTSSSRMKRGRSGSYSSDSRSPSPPPAKKRRDKERGRADYDDEGDGMDISTEIWKLFGKDKRRYVERDVLSDDSDMEVDTRTLEREEKISMRIAKKEEEAALEEERRHEEEKRRRKKEKDMRERRG